jgi:hypothetical protein
MVVWPDVAIAADDPSVLGTPLDFFLFALTLPGVALFHCDVVATALCGLATIVQVGLSMVAPRLARGDRLHVPIFLMLLVRGWNSHERERPRQIAPSAVRWISGEESKWN